MFKKYDKCIFCNSKKFKIEKIQQSKINFYVRSIISDLNLKLNDFKKFELINVKIASFFKITFGLKKKYRKKFIVIFMVNIIEIGLIFCTFVNKGIKPDHGDL